MPFWICMRGGMQIRTRIFLSMTSYMCTCWCFVYYSSMPVLDNKYMKKQRTSDGKKLFEYITEDALRKEAEANPSEQALENLKQAYRTISTTGFAGSATSDLRNSAKIHPFPDGGV